MFLSIPLSSSPFSGDPALASRPHPQPTPCPLPPWSLSFSPSSAAPAALIPSPPPTLSLPLVSLFLPLSPSPPFSPSLIEQSSCADSASINPRRWDLSFDSDDVEDDRYGEEYWIPVAHPVAHPVSDYDIVIDALPLGAIFDLHEMAKRMVAACFGKECSHVYNSYRRDFLGESFS